jgi:hypothetical protein
MRFFLVMLGYARLCSVGSFLAPLASGGTLSAVLPSWFKLEENITKPHQIYNKHCDLGIMFWEPAGSKSLPHLI